MELFLTLLSLLFVAVVAYIITKIVVFFLEKLYKEKKETSENPSEESYLLQKKDKKGNLYSKVPINCLVCPLVNFCHKDKKTEYVHRNSFICRQRLMALEVKDIMYFINQ